MEVTVTLPTGATVMLVLPMVHTDPRRRTIYEMNMPDCSVQGFRITGPFALGNHYHTKKSERFKIEKGLGVVITQWVDHNGMIISEKCVRPLKEGDVVNVSAFTVHTFIFDIEGGGLAEMTCVSSAPFDENDKDMVPAKLVEEGEVGRFLAVADVMRDEGASILIEGDVIG